LGSRSDAPGHRFRRTWAKRQPVDLTYVINLADANLADAEFTGAKLAKVGEEALGMGSASGATTAPSFPEDT
jgi:hypothetical protein